MPSDFPWLANNTWGIARLNLLTQGGDQHAQLEFAYGSEGTGPLNPMSDAGGFAIYFIDDLLPLLSTSCSLKSVQVYLNVGGSIETATYIPAPNAGGVGGEPMVPSVAVILKKTSNRIGRHGHGRVYVPGIPQSYQDSANAGQLGATPFANLTAAFATFYAHLQSIELQQALISRHQWGTPLPTYQFIGVTGFLAEQTFATQRRRLRRAAHR